MAVADFLVHQDVTPSPVSETDGQTILADVQAFEPTILDALSAIVAKQAAIEGIPLGGVGSIVLSDLQALNASTVAFGSALIAAAPVRCSYFTLRLLA